MSDSTFSLIGTIVKSSVFKSSEIVAKKSAAIRNERRLRNNSMGSTATASFFKKSRTCENYRAVESGIVSAESS